MSALVPAPAVGEVLWARVRTRWRKVRVLKVNRVTFAAELIRPMRTRTELYVGQVPWNIGAAEVCVRREQPDHELGAEWRELEYRTGVRRQAEGT